MRMMLAPALMMFLASPAFAATEAANSPVMTTTPSGEGDPGAITCRAPQALPSGEMGPQICIHNSVWARLTLTGQDLSADGKSVAARATTNDPTGDGNPDAVTCRRPAQFTASRTKHGPEVCLTNRYWKQLADKQMRVNSAGQLVSTKANGPGGAGPGGIPEVMVESSPAL
jgi:hypothetical protein